MKKSELRQHWARVPIDDLITEKGLFKDGDWVESKDQNPEGEVRLVQLADIGDGFFKDISNRYLTRTTALKLKCTFLKKGDVLIARMPDPIGRACIFPLDGCEEYVTVVDVAIIRLGIASIDDRFFTYSINSLNIRSEIEKLQSGTTRKRISRKNLATIEFDIPPLPEQRAIVTKLETLLSELDNAVASLKQAKEQLKTYRQAVLKAAFTGKLTEEWRKQQTDLSTADELLAQIQTERQRYYEQQLADYKAGKIKTRPTSMKHIPTCKESEFTQTHHLPETWTWTCLRSIDIDIIDGDRGKNYPHKEEFTATGYCLFLNTKNVLQGFFDFTKVMFISEEKSSLLRQGKLIRGDVILTTRGTIGNSACFNSNVQYDNIRINSGMVILRPNRTIWDPEYINMYIQSLYFKNEIETSRTGTAQPQLPVNILNSFHLPLQCVKEQSRVVQEIESRFSTADQLEQTIDDSLSKTEALKHSLLKQAFEGKLLTEQELEKSRQAPDWEPAEKLLERIKLNKGS